MASIKQLDERRYKITVSNGYRPNGKKISKAKTIQVPPGVPKRGIGQYVAHAAEELERSFKTGYAEDGEMTFEEFASRWLKRQTKYAPSTIAAYRRMLEVVYPIIGGIRLNKLRPMALENMLSELRKRKHHGKRINESTAQRYLSVVSAVLSDAKRNEIIEKNPARMLDLPTPQRTVQRIPTRGEVEKLLDALAKEPRHYRLFFLLSMYTGCRRGELCALQWSDFTGTQNGLLLTVSRSRSSVPGKGIVEGSTKNGKTVKSTSPLTCGASSSPTSAASRWRRTSSAVGSVPTSSPTSRGSSSTRTPSPSGCGRSMTPSAFRGSTISTPYGTTS